jgi:hypothetical protein
MRAPDHPLVSIENPAIFASEAGFDGERAVDTWRRRMKKLAELNFILPKRGPSGDFHYVLLLNPNVAMELMRRKGLVRDGVYSRFLDRLAEVGGYGELESIREFWAQQEAAQAASQAAAASTSEGGVAATAATAVVAT